MKCFAIQLHSPLSTLHTKLEVVFMPSVFLSPSTQEFNPYIDGGNEEYYMNIITDALIPYLEASGIEYERNNPSKTFANSVKLSNQGNFDLHLALHSNAAPPANAGQARGSQVYYYADSVLGKRAANIFANNLKEIYPIPSKVETVPTKTLGELNRTKAPAILIELAYHDNPEDAQWIRDNIGTIAQNLAVSVSDFLGIKENQPTPMKTGIVTTQNSNLNLRAEPSENARIVGRIPNGSTIAILGNADNWYLTKWNGISGYVSAKYVKLQ